MPFEDFLADMLKKERPWGEIETAIHAHLMQSGNRYAERQRLARVIGDKAPDAALTGRVQDFLANVTR